MSTNPQSEHTPGPWESRPDDYPELVRAPGGGTVAHCGAEHDVYHGHEPATAIANARLIAAAPDLLAACKAQDKLIRFYGILLANYRTGSRPGEMTLDEVNKAAAVTDAASSAIAKAGGAA